MCLCHSCYLPITLILCIWVIFPLGSITVGTSNIHLPPLSNTIHRRLVFVLIHTSSLHYDIFWQGHLPKHQSWTVRSSGTHTPSAEYPSLLLWSLKGIWHQSCRLPGWQLSNTVSWLISTFRTIHTLCQALTTSQTVLLRIKNWIYRRR